MKIQLFKTAAIFLTILIAVDANLFVPKVLQPVKPGGEPLALIIIPGALCKAKQYIDLAKQIQRQSEFKLWVVIPTFTLNLAEPIELNLRIAQARRGLQQQGFPQGAKIYLAGHSLGGVMAQNYLQKMKQDFIGLILLGSNLTRQKFALTSQGQYTLLYPTPTLILGGQKDGLTRPIKLSEAHLRLSLQSADKPAGDKFNQLFPVVLLQGVNHMNFADGGNSFFTKKRDFRSQVSSIEQAHRMIAQVVTDFMTGIYGRLVEGADSCNYKKIPALIQNSLQYFLPNIQAMRMQGSYFLKPPCFTKPNINPPNTQCTHGSPWVQVAQKKMAGIQVSGIKSVRATVDDNSHRVWSVTPVHLPHIWNSCAEQGRNNQTCVLNMTTVSQTIYKTFSKQDPGSVGGSAIQIRAKLTSRQNAWEKAGVSNPIFNQTDSGNLCGDINQIAIDWAINMAPERTRQRYEQIGVQMVIGPDQGPYVQGNQWISHQIQYELVKDQNGQTVLRVSSPFNATPTKYIIQKAAGFHYCQVLSPLKVMEWIYSGSLQLNDHV